MSFAAKLASFKKKGPSTKKPANLETSEPHVPAQPPPQPFRVSVVGTALTAAKLWFHFREVGGVLSITMTSSDRAEVAFQTKLGWMYAIQRMNGICLAPDEPPLQIAAILSEDSSLGESLDGSSPSQAQEVLPLPPIVVVGGVGGSGTRWVSQVIAALGIEMGHDQNESLDNLTYTLLFKRLGVLTDDDPRFDMLVRSAVQHYELPLTVQIDILARQGSRMSYRAAFHSNAYTYLILSIMAKGMGCGGALTQAERDLAQSLTSAEEEEDRGNAGAPTPWLRERCRRLEQKAAATSGSTGALLWGWKEPNSHILLDRLMTRFPNMKYIHVMRSGLDMAHSDNQNQLKLWGKHFLGAKTSTASSSYAQQQQQQQQRAGAWDGMVGPNASLRYWSAVHKRVVRLGQALGPEKFCLLNFDAICKQPKAGVSAIADFLGFNPPESLINELSSLVQIKPGSMHRWRHAGGLALFDRDDVAYVKEMGFDTREEVADDDAVALSSSVSEPRRRDPYSAAVVVNVHSKGEEGSSEAETGEGALGSRKRQRVSASGEDGSGDLGVPKEEK